MTLDAKIGRFSADFQWGVATAAYQIEGAVQEDGRGLSIWDDFSHTPGKVLHGDTGDIACDHYHRMAGDVALIAQLGVSHYRFSIAWPRILPEGRISGLNAKGLAFYDRLVDTLLSHGISPAATLYHWDLPSALQQQGGWMKRGTAETFAEYAQLMACTLGDRVPQWITHNEPWCTAVLGHLTGEHAPGLADPQKALSAAHHVLLSHGLATQAIRAVRPDAAVGITLNLTTVYAQDDALSTQRAVTLQDVFSNRWYLDPLFRGQYPLELADVLGSMPTVLPGDMEVIAQPLDFLGVNYYSAHVVAANPESLQGWPVLHVTPKDRVTDMNWPVIPHGLRDLLVRLTHDYGPMPLVITENGAAYPDVLKHGSVGDSDRILYLQEHIEAVADALEAGADVRGYYVWSLMDNFEWALGYSKRFGLIYVDFASQVRTLKESAQWYRKFLQQVAREPANR